MEYRCQKMRRLLLSFLLCFGIAGCDALQKSNQADPPILNRNFTNVSITGTGGEVGTTTAVTVTLVDKQGYGFANYTPVITAVDAANSNAAITYSACGVTNNSGIANCYITSNTAGTYTLEISSPVSAVGSQITFTQIARGLKFVTQPSSTSVSAVAFATQPAVEIVDNVGNLIPSSDGTVVTASLTSASGATLSGTLTATTTGGASLATFVGLTVDLAGTYTLTASATGLSSAVSSSFTITAAAASKLAFTTAPSSSAAANTAFAVQPVVSLEDAQGNVITSNNLCVVTLSLTTSANAADTLLGNQLSVKTTSGVASFAGSNLRINTEYGGTNAYVITAAPSAACGSSITSATTSNISITLSGVPASILLTQTPSSPNTLNVPFTTQPQVTVYDALGAVATSDNTTVITVSFSTYSTGGTAGTLLGSTSIGVTNGVATFSDLEIEESATPATDAGTYYLLYTATNPNTVSFPTTISGSTYVNSNGTVPAKLSFSTQPAKAAKLQTMSPFKVQILDANGYICSNDNSDTVTIAAIPQGGGTGSASGTLTQTAVNGIATFNDIDINYTGVYTIQATSSSLTSATSAAFAITSFGNADHPKFTVQPNTTSTVTGAAFTTQPKVAIEDIGGNVVTSDESSVVTLTCVNPSGCTLLGNTTQTVVNGVATFSGLSFGAAESAAVLMATVSGGASTLSSTTTDSNSFTVTSMGTLTFSTQPSTTSSVTSAALTVQPVVHVNDSTGTLSSSDNSTTVTLSCIAPSGCVLSGTTSVLDVNGVATFSGLSVNEASGTSGIQLQATATSLTTGTSSTFAIP